MFKRRLAMDAAVEAGRNHDDDIEEAEDAAEDHEDSGSDEEVNHQ